MLPATVATSTETKTPNDEVHQGTALDPCVSPKAQLDPSSLESFEGSICDGSQHRANAWEYDGQLCELRRLARAA